MQAWRVDKSRANVLPHESDYRNFQEKPYCSVIYTFVDYIYFATKTYKFLQYLQKIITSKECKSMYVEQCSEDCEKICYCCKSLAFKMFLCHNMRYFRNVSLKMCTCSERQICLPFMISQTQIHNFMLCLFNLRFFRPYLPSTGLPSSQSDAGLHK